MWVHLPRQEARSNAGDTELDSQHLGSFSASLSPSVTFSKEILHATVPVEKNVTRCLLGHV